MRQVAWLFLICTAFCAVHSVFINDEGAAESTAENTVQLVSATNLAVNADGPRRNVARVGINGIYFGTARFPRLHKCNVYKKSICGPTSFTRDFLYDKYKKMYSKCGDHRCRSLTIKKYIALDEIQGGINVFLQVQFSAKTDATFTLRFQACDTLRGQYSTRLCRLHVQRDRVRNKGYVRDLKRFCRYKYPYNQTRCQKRVTSRYESSARSAWLRYQSQQIRIHKELTKSSADIHAERQKRIRKQRALEKKAAAYRKLFTACKNLPCQRHVSRNRDRFLKYLRALDRCGNSTACRNKAATEYKRAFQSEMKSYRQSVRERNRLLDQRKRSAYRNIAYEQEKEKRERQVLNVNRSVFCESAYRQRLNACGTESCRKDATKDRTRYLEFQKSLERCESKEYCRGQARWKYKRDTLRGYGYRAR